MKLNRRNFLSTAGITAAALAGLNRTGLAADNQIKKIKKVPFELGIASYTFRSFDLDQTLAMTNQLAMKNISFKSMHMPLNSTPAQIDQIIAKAQKAGINVYGAGVIYMKSEEQVIQAFNYAKAAKLQTIIGVPSYELLHLVERKVKETNIKVAIHNHGPSDKLFPSPESIIEKIKDLDPRIGLCMDIGHTQRCGISPAADVLRFKDRLHDLHLKDVTKAEESGKTIEMGRGVIDIPALFKALIKVNYQGKASFEFEKDGKNPLPGLAESVGYARGVLASVI